MAQFLIGEESALGLQRANRFHPALQVSLDSFAIDLPRYLRLGYTETKGYGLFATENIPAGTLIIAERPLLPEPSHMNYRALSAHDIVRKFTSLSGLEQHQYMTLACHEYNVNATMDEFTKLKLQQTQLVLDEWLQFAAFLHGVYQTNAHRGGVYRIAARMNHDCTPNCEYHVIDSHTGEELEIINNHVHPPTAQSEIRVHAVRDIEAGEELTESYHPCFGSSAEEKFEYLQKWGIVCKCSACVFAPGAVNNLNEGRDERERNRSRIRRVGNDIRFLCVRLLHIEHHLHHPWLLPQLDPIPHGPLSPNVVSSTPSAHGDRQPFHANEEFWTLLTSPQKEGDLLSDETILQLRRGHNLAYCLFLRERTKKNAERMYKWTSELIRRVTILRGRQSPFYKEIMEDQTGPCMAVKACGFAGVYTGKKEDSKIEGNEWLTELAGQG